MSSPDGRVGHAFADTALVIQWHVLGMYIPSFFTGHLVRLWGERRVVYAGLGLLFTSVFVNLAGYELFHYTVGLTLLGLGWNLLFFGSSAQARQINGRTHLADTLDIPETDLKAGSSA